MEWARGADGSRLWRMTLDEVRAAAMQLDPLDRAVLAADLQSSLSHPETATQEEIDAEWTDELRRRSDDLRSGRVQAVSWDEIRVSIESDRAARR